MNFEKALKELDKGNKLARHSFIDKSVFITKIDYNDVKISLLAISTGITLELIELSKNDILNYPIFDINSTKSVHSRKHLLNEKDINGDDWYVFNENDNV